MVSLQTKFIEKEIPYNGGELRSHFIYHQFDILGDAAVAFIGSSKVDLNQMVDLEDVKQKKPIYSEKMVHFLIEHFETNLKQMVFCQRILIALMLEEILKRTKRAEPLSLRRIGDDLFDNEAKLTVSIATATPVSSVIHTGINISSRNTPVLTKGLEDYSIDPKDFAETMLQSYQREIESIQKAVCKVRGVL